MLHLHVPRGGRGEAALDGVRTVGTDISTTGHKNRLFCGRKQKLPPLGRERAKLPPHFEVRQEGARQGRGKFALEVEGNSGRKLLWKSSNPPIAYTSSCL